MKISVSLPVSLGSVPHIAWRQAEGKVWQASSLVLVPVLLRTERGSHGGTGRPRGPTAPMRPKTECTHPLPVSRRPSPLKEVPGAQLIAKELRASQWTRRPFVVWGVSVVIKPSSECRASGGGEAGTSGQMEKLRVWF